MEPNQNTNMQNATSVPTSTGVSNVSSTSLNMPDKSVESSKPGSDVVFQDKPKKNMGVILTIVLLALLAAGGIGFGVWAMMDGNSQVAKKDEQISALKKQNSELQDKVTEMEEASSKNELEAIEEQNQNEETGGQIDVERTEETSNEEGYRVISIGDCFFDGGAAIGGINMLKCEAETSLGKGKFVWDSERNELFFALPNDNQ